ncbi:hypothetical protein [Micromonospora sp. HM5-17]|jgi:hypothetical protein|uniref:hypothetical protein n=1 Tax=Micromonospora sp. HM5-17 TaxID=2487710 RepID=UPI000F4946C4|nr:hypothetical protein [Micromonospora sp. HM5-17]ROT33262.1 hypothetical protein EF879_09210 [Micromonospora sp. HM5-17]
MMIRGSTPPGHAAVRPQWSCSCGQRCWPCPTARTILLLTTDRLSLARSATTWVYDAARELPDVTPAELFDRFVGWTR